LVTIQATTAEATAKSDTKTKFKSKTHKTSNSLDVPVPVPVESRIVGGTDAAPDSYPFFVQGNGCGGSLIWDDIVLTAAHCLGAFDGSVLVGPYIQFNTAGGAEVIETLEEVPHPSYRTDPATYDFMLVQLARPVSNPALVPIAVNDVPTTPADNDVLTVIGFGTTSEGGSTSNRLQQVTVNYFDYEKCNQLYGGQIVDSVMFCAGVPGGGKDSCQGDSGGPIFDATGTQV
jgi:trypsin